MKPSEEKFESVKRGFSKVADMAISEVKKRVENGEADFSDLRDWLVMFLMGAAEGGKQGLSETESLRALENPPELPRRNPNLKDCPFCGGPAYISDNRNQAAKFIEHRICVQCENCLARSKVFSWKLDALPTDKKQLPESVKWSAISAWNNRPACADEKTQL
jgi:hypothetical protein